MSSLGWDDRPPREYIRVEDEDGRIVGKCGECGEVCGWKAINSCPYCGTEFKEITSPFEREFDFCRRFRPDLRYVVYRWA